MREIKDYEKTDHIIELEKQFNLYKYGVMNLSKLEKERDEIKAALEQKEKEIADVRSELPEEIITLYEQQQVVWKLKGKIQ